MDEVNPPPPGGRNYVDKKIRDARGNLVSDKTANKPFLVYREWKVKEEEKERLKAEKAKRRAEKIARGEALGPEDELEKEPSAVLAIAQLVLFLVGSVVLAGWFITGSPLWGYDGKWAHLRTYIPQPQKLFTIEELARHDGSTPGTPIYLAIDAKVYDVTAGAHNYGIGGGYHNFAGIDASRAWATQCLRGHRTHDLRGLTAEELRSKDHWRNFFDNNRKYPHIGRVLLIPIDPQSPIPGACETDNPKSPSIGPQPPPPHQPSGKANKEL
ncbi:hypothetical protein BS47DRAFT_1294139 [Hydnum rufescens UP504]|uniref:Cytochrome b5 heme-binding domain-containing protein n=1 Tax=Hydnum rufescens UP504 TaxID=1448309 RepID=A0A9P6B1E6_9AGAM|nr:hypothetical protein BS47DRAFT_1294139 [Hydnum rufescens UP504]